MVSIAHYVAVCVSTRAADVVAAYMYLNYFIYPPLTSFFFHPSFLPLVRASKILAPDPDDESGTTALDVRRACCPATPNQLVFNTQGYFNYPSAPLKP